ncbi:MULTISPECIES: YitT family protein [Psychrobacillus]|uniref:YitT family protein n=1 Tax=Psychrobacillus faecigallinarum TaxID=2762235 RepID=A0ABR8RAQ3_9BACI|nr:MULTISPECIES: YitT family protein [Psychrobacillus]MBD7944602.1 YitT family protein [Psychrobacillus faecigallinarum]QEY19512.1 YitT family protein [Psychrobacillus sp. AK 1817]QGM30011.1 DUF2179 domain-containing protein [Bacillus sp. N3536]
MKNFIVITLGSLFMAVALNLFLVPHEVILGGFSGIGMIIGILTNWNIGWIIFILNVPVFILGFVSIGKKFVAYSMYSVFLTSLAMQYIPVVQVTEDILLSSVFGAVIGGAATGMIIKFNGSTGGIDIIGLVITKKKDFSLGTMMLVMNSVIVLASGYFIGWEQTMYTLLVLYVFGKVVDVIHTKHVKITLMIITEKGEEVQKKLLQNLVRGITVLDGEGAYTKQSRKVLFTVITRYELGEVKKMIKEVDSNAFVNITETIEVMGAFNKN